MTEYKLSASLAGHDDDVRGVAFPSSKAVVSVSRDATVRFWKLLSESPPTYDGIITYHGSAFINSVAYMPPSTTYPDGLIISGGKDTIIEVRQPTNAPDENADALLLGHSHNVCALDVDTAGKFIVSGGWDGQARTWTVGKWECDTVFEGHEGSVWAVLAFDSETIITGCADKLIRVFHKSGKLLRTIRGSSDVVRALCRVPSGHPSDADFASAGNDGIIRLWTINGKQTAELAGHENFVYSLASLPSGELVSSGEDRTVRIWKGFECIQTITHPAISVWGVAVCPENGDIVSGASDRIVRVFTRSADRTADSEALLSFEESVKASSIPQQQLPEINKENLPGPDFLTSKSGTKEGQTQMIREHDGSITAHQWSAGRGEWIVIGTVVDAVGSSGRKVDYLGKSYDFVFDVDIEDGKPPLKLPYNLSQNPYEAATKFIEDNELPISYLDEVANFITKNTQGATIGSSQNQGPAPPGSDPWGSESRYRPGGEQRPEAPPPSAPKYIPQKTYLPILVARLDAMQKKLQEINQDLRSSGQKDIALNPTELGILATLSQHLESAGATKTSQDVSGGLELAIKVGTKWPYASRLPGLDLLRLLGVAPRTATYQSPRGANIVEILRSSVTEQFPPAENHVMMALRAFANLFESEEGRGLAVAEFKKITALIAAATATKSSNKNLVVAATTVYIHYAVLLTSTPDSGSAFDQSLALLEFLSKFLNTQVDSEAVFRALVATGTLLSAGSEVKGAAKEVYAIPEAVQAAVSKGSDPRIKNIAAEIRALLK